MSEENTRRHEDEAPKVIEDLALEETGADAVKGGEVRFSPDGRFLLVTHKVSD